MVLVGTHGLLDEGLHLTVTTFCHTHSKRVEGQLKELQSKSEAKKNQVRALGDVFERDNGPQLLTVIISSLSNFKYRRSKRDSNLLALWKRERTLVQHSDVSSLFWSRGWFDFYEPNHVSYSSYT